MLPSVTLAKLSVIVRLTFRRNDRGRTMEHSHRGRAGGTHVAGQTRTPRCGRWRVCEFVGVDPSNLARIAWLRVWLPAKYTPVGGGLLAHPKALDAFGNARTVQGLRRGSE